MQHNPSIKAKTELKTFLESAHNVCPKSKDTVPENFFVDIYNEVTNNPFYTPNTRSLIDENFNLYTLNEIDIKLSKINEKTQQNEISENEFINSIDLTQKQLFHYNNTLKVPENLVP